ncbi:hypothetical protein AB205_0075890 [Aquarana catesbeiana]|uniref:Uncharacterized protein n=1 Tax=Aquarana catesbeiana TaxID=8400 RepID=A0A2G9SIG0_AQUCT|nr:hypothetical protein AB205_0075890 [Aquarana catesbeiana]
MDLCTHNRILHHRTFVAGKFVCLHSQHLSDENRKSLSSGAYTRPSQYSFPAVMFVAAPTVGMPSMPAHCAEEILPSASGSTTAPKNSLQGLDGQSQPMAFYIVLDTPSVRAPQQNSQLCFCPLGFFCVFLPTFACSSTSCYILCNLI